jgi:hypothetical protein
MKNGLTICRLTVMCMAASFIATAGETNGISPELLHPTVTWGRETDGVRGGLVITSKKGRTSVVISVLGSETNSAWNYVKPPESRMAKIELKDHLGNLVKVTKIGAKAVGDLPESIASEDVPRVKEGFFRPGRRDGMIINNVLIASNAPATLHSFILEDYFVMQPSHKYTLSITPTIYKFSPDRKRVQRIDLPEVSASIPP